MLRANQQSNQNEIHYCSNNWGIFAIKCVTEFVNKQFTKVRKEENGKKVSNKMNKNSCIEIKNMVFII